jgi:anti-anti-sigma regulatory factor
MTLRIETTRDHATTVHHLIGRIDAENLTEVEAQLRGGRGEVALDLEEVMLVDMDAVRFLVACEAEGIGLLHCLPYIRAWMDREQSRAD